MNKTILIAAATGFVIMTAPHPSALATPLGVTRSAAQAPDSLVDEVRAGGGRGGGGGHARAGGARAGGGGGAHRSTNVSRAGSGNRAANVNRSGNVHPNANVN